MKSKGQFPRGKVAFFVTSSIHKFNKARQVLAEYKVATAMLKIGIVEIQDDSNESQRRRSREKV